MGPLEGEVITVASAGQRRALGMRGRTSLRTGGVALVYTYAAACCTESFGPFERAFVSGVTEAGESPLAVSPEDTGRCLLL